MRPPGACPACGARPHSGTLRCQCGFDPLDPRREAVRAVGWGALGASAPLVVFWTRHWLFAPLVGLAFHAVVLLIGLLCAARGVHFARMALTGPAITRGLATLGLLLAASFALLPLAAWLVTRAD